MIVRSIDLLAEYDRLSTWWTKHGLAAPPRIVLAGAAGFSVRSGGVDVVAGWIYVSKNVGFAEWTVSNPFCGSRTMIAFAIRHLFDHLEKYAKSEGCNVVLCGVQDNGSMGRFLQKYGWLRCDGPSHQFLAKGVA